MRFSDVQHQPRAVSLLRRSLRSGRTHHAYLLDGPLGVGKELAARALAARLLCEGDALPPDADACGACRACRLMAADNHPDFHLVHRGLLAFHPDRAVRQRSGLFLTVDVIRHFLIEPAANAPTLGRRRVFLLRDAERMNEQAQNALLKTLEEPPGSACLILVTSAASRLLATIRSRCQRVPFDLLPGAFVAQRLAEARVPDEQARLLAALSQGSLGAALRWAQGRLLDDLEDVAQLLSGARLIHPEKTGEQMVEIARRLALRLAQASATGDADADEDEPRAEPDSDDGEADAESDGRRAPGRAAERAVPTDQLRDALKLVLMLAAAIFREALLHRVEAAGTLRAFERPPAAVETLSSRLSAARLADALEAVGQCERMLDRNVAARLACERLCVAVLAETPV
ncbi:MAG: DNA polymerase III subunit delta' [Phycisphaerae bacterium]|nr:DNA polymerase III subunit delta' [Phycisphaerae bacterium]MCZ2400898.1 DNA polymerase III subunit delta' [Phycisphaerae bacterium]